MENILILGGGAVVRECFVPALESLGLVDRTVIADPRAATAGLPDSVRVVAAGYEDALARAKADGTTHCVVALPNALHVDAVRRALEVGLHVFCEKPLTLRAAEATELARQAERAGRLLAVNMVRRRFPSVQLAKDVLARGWLGTLESVRISHGGAYAWPIASLAPFERRNGGVLADMGVHYLDLAEMLVGTLTPVRYRDDDAGGVESECEFVLNTADRVPVTIALSRLGPLANEIELIGSNGILRFGVDDFDWCVLEDRNGKSEPVSLTRRTADSPGFSDFFAAQLTSFLDASEAASDDIVDGHAAARTAAHIEWAYVTRQPDRPRPSATQLPEGPVYVTGATGFIGSHLIGRLAEVHRPAIKAGYHSLRGCAAISRHPVEYHKTELLDPDSLRIALRGQRFVFHLAFGRDAGEERAVTVQGTKNLVEAAIAEKVESVVILSTMYVLGHPGGVVNETAPYRPIGGTYGTTKAEMEQWCLERAKSSESTRIAVLLPTCVYGPRGSTYTTMPVTFAREGRFCWIAQGAGSANVVYVENLIDAMIQAATAPAAHGERFIISDECLTWREFLSPLLGPWAASVPAVTDEEFQALTAEPKGPGVREVAAAVLKSPQVWDALSRSRLGNHLRPFLKERMPGVIRLRRNARLSQPPLPKRLPPPGWLAEVYGPSQTRFSAEKARHILGWTPRIATEEAVSQSVRWLQHQGLYTRD